MTNSGPYKNRTSHCRGRLTGQSFVMLALFGACSQGFDGVGGGCQSQCVCSSSDAGCLTKQACLPV
jgi:hypothetical protein